MSKSIDRQGVQGTINPLDLGSRTLDSLDVGGGDSLTSYLNE